jgi:anti-sigma B factor antagonist
MDPRAWGTRRCGKREPAEEDAVPSCHLVIESLGPDTVRVQAEGDLSGPSAYTLDAELMRVEAMRPARLVLDLSRVTFIDSAGLARVLGAHRRAQREGRRFVVVEGTAAVRRLIALTALDQRLELARDTAAALA